MLIVLERGSDQSEQILEVRTLSNASRPRTFLSYCQTE